MGILKLTNGSEIHFSEKSADKMISATFIPGMTYIIGHGFLDESQNWSKRYLYSEWGKRDSEWTD